MLEDDIVACPVCDHDLNVKILRQKRIAYIVPEDCPNCKTSAARIEKLLNYRGPKIKTERSYIKLDPRG